MLVRLSHAHVIVIFYFYNAMCLTLCHPLMPGQPAVEDTTSVPEAAGGFLQRRDSQRPRQHGVPCRDQTGTGATFTPTLLCPAGVASTSTFSEVHHFLRTTG